MNLLEKLKMRFTGKDQPEHLRRGELGERAAEKYLRRRGLKFLTANFRSARGEIDLVFRDHDCLHFEDIDPNFSPSPIHYNAFNSAVSFRLATSQTDMTKRRDGIKPCKVARQATRGRATRRAWEFS